MSLVEDKTKETLIQTSLGAAVPLWAMRVFDEPERYTASENIERISKILCEKGDLFLFRSKKKGETAMVFNAVAEGIAILSFAPGGVRIFGLHFEYYFGGKSPFHKPEKKPEIVKALEARLSDWARRVRLPGRPDAEEEIFEGG